MCIYMCVFLYLNKYDTLFFRCVSIFNIIIQLVYFYSYSSNTRFIHTVQYRSRSGTTQPLSVDAAAAAASGSSSCSQSVSRNRSEESRRVP